MNDIGREVVLTGGNEDLAAGKPVATIRLWGSFRLEQTKVGTAVRFGQAHGAGPFTRDQFWQVQRLLLGRAVRMQTLVSAMREARVHGPCLIGRVQHLVEGVVQHHRQSLATEPGIAGEGWPASFHILAVGLAKSLRCGHAVRGGVETTTQAISRLIQGKYDAGSELAALLEHLIQGVDIELRMGREWGQCAFGIQQFMQHELHVTQRGTVAGHGCLLGRLCLSLSCRLARLRHGVDAGAHA